MKNREIAQKHIDRIVEKRDNLKATNNKLRRYCHIYNCAIPSECPERHTSCKQQLDLDTAIAWVATAQLSACMRILSTIAGEQRVNMTDLTLLLRTYNRVSILRRVVDLHAPKYTSLFQTITEALVDLRESLYITIEAVRPFLNKTETEIVEDSCMTI